MQCISTESETGAFGPRTEGGTALYQIKTQALIAPSPEAAGGDAELPPTMAGASVARGVAVALGRGLGLFNGSCSEQPTIIEFGAGGCAATGKRGP